MLLHHGPLADGEQALELAVAHALVQRASTGEVSEAVRIYRPRRPVVVFGRRDTRLPGFPEAARVAAEAGFAPLVRPTGGRAVAYTGEAIVVDHVKHDLAGLETQERRFEVFGERLAGLFRRLGVDARVGAVPGEYCPGAHSVNARGTVKLVGTAQRIVRNAWLFSSLVVVGDERRLRPVLAQVYGCLEQPFDPASVGSLSSEVPTLTTDVVERAMIAAYGLSPADASPLPPETRSLAHELVDEHRPAGR
jgi:lipoate-protein ligase A